VLNRVENTEYPRANTVVYTQEFPITVPMVGIGRMSRLNARCLPIVLVKSRSDCKYDLSASFL